MILLCPPEKSTQFHYPLDPKKIRAEGSIHKDTTYQGSDRKDFYRHGKKKKKEKKENKQTKRRPRLGLPIGNPVISFHINYCILSYSSADHQSFERVKSTANSTIKVSFSG